MPLALALTIIAILLTVIVILVIPAVIITKGMGVRYVYPPAPPAAAVIPGEVIEEDPGMANPQPPDPRVEKTWVNDAGELFVSDGTSWLPYEDLPDWPDEIPPSSMSATSRSSKRNGSARSSSGRRSWSTGSRPALTG